MDSDKQIAPGTKLYVTTWALTAGIYEVIANDKTRIENNNLNYRVSNWRGNLFIGKDDWHATLESAQKRVEVLRMKKIASIKKQLAKLENYTAEVSPWHDGK